MGSGWRWHQSLEWGDYVRLLIGLLGSGDGLAVLGGAEWTHDGVVVIRVWSVRCRKEMSRCDELAYLTYRAPNPVGETGTSSTLHIVGMIER